MIVIDSFAWITTCRSVRGRQKRRFSRHVFVRSPPVNLHLRGEMGRDGHRYGGEFTIMMADELIRDDLRTRLQKRQNGSFHLHFRNLWPLDLGSYPAMG